MPVVLLPVDTLCHMAMFGKLVIHILEVITNLSSMDVEDGREEK